MRGERRGANQNRGREKKMEVEPARSERKRLAGVDGGGREATARERERRGEKEGEERDWRKQEREEGRGVTSESNRGGNFSRGGRARGEEGGRQATTKEA